MKAGEGWRTSANIRRQSLASSHVPARNVADQPMVPFTVFRVSAGGRVGVWNKQILVDISHKLQTSLYCGNKNKNLCSSQIFSCVGIEPATYNAKGPTERWGRSKLFYKVIFLRFKSCADLDHTHLVRCPSVRIHLSSYVFSSLFTTLFVTSNAHTTLTLLLNLSVT